MHPEAEFALMKPWWYVFAWTGMRTAVGVPAVLEAELRATVARLKRAVWALDGVAWYCSTFPSRLQLMYRCLRPWLNRLPPC